MWRIVCVLVLCALLGCSTAPLDEVDSQIVGGNTTTVSDNPWLVSVLVLGVPTCGGSILNRRWILTAAHCVSSEKVKYPTNVSIRYYYISYDTYPPQEKPNTIYALQFRIHDKYDGETYAYDVAVVELERSLKLGTLPQVIKIVDAGDPPRTGTSLKIAGWGALKENATRSETVQEVTIAVVRQSTCARAYEKLGYTLLSTQICAAAADKGICEGDFGGPIVDSNNVQVGIASWGHGCARKKLPGIYTNLAEPTINSWVRSAAGLRD